MRVIFALRMRRVFSISTMLVLLCSTFSPLWAGDMDTMQAPSCHRMSMQDASAKQKAKRAHAHHCDSMDTQAMQSTSGVSITPGHSHSCPMNCCIQGAPTSRAAVSATTFLPPLAVVEAEFEFASITFASAGFSSHTDRGPPAA
jgi:hypothetical protein